MRQKSAETYENLLRHYNRRVPQLVECECGKITTQNGLEAHQRTGVHKLLLAYKEQCQKIKDETLKQEKEEEPKKYKSQWDKMVRCV